MNMNIKKITIGALVALSVVVVPSSASAVGLAFSSAKKTYAVGDTVSLVVYVETGGNPINTVSGTVAIPTGSLDVQEIRYGNSIVSLWVEKPTLERSSGKVRFSGGVPGGYNGTRGQLFTVVARARTEGPAEVGASGVEILKNDGLGTVLEGIGGASLALSIIKPAPKAPQVPAEVPATSTPAVVEEIPEPDTVSPQEFIPLVSSHEGIFDGKKFVSFSAVDKEGGIEKYEVREEPYFLRYFTRASWLPAESPYLLSWQIWPTVITVRAYDTAGNFREAGTDKGMNPGIALLAVSLLALVGLYFRGSPQKKARPQKRKTVQ